jgi:hypothetical protein
MTSRSRRILVPEELPVLETTRSPRRSTRNQVRIRMPCSLGARNRVGMSLLYRPARLHMLVELIPGLLKSLKILALNILE